MSNATWAIPGLMPPQTPNEDCNIVLPENGKCTICVHCGVEADMVTYSMVIPGLKGGVILDPAYDTGDPAEVSDKMERYVSYIHTVTELPEGTIVPRKRLAYGRTVPITERPELAPEDVRYRVLILPQGVLPEGDTTIEIIANGKLTKYIVQRPVSVREHYTDVTPIKTEI